MTGANATLERRLREHGFTPVTAIVFVIFVLLYSPCFAALIAIGKEIGMKWAFFRDGIHDGTGLEACVS